MKKIFVGGYGGTGSRVFQRILLESSEYYIGTHNFQLDWLVDNGPYVPYVATDAWKTGNFLPLKILIDQTITGKNYWSLKHGHLMFNFAQLKKAYPGCVCVLTVRHPLDTVTNAYAFHASHGELPLNASIDDKLDFYNKAHQEALKYTDFLFRLEDAVYKTEETVRRVLSFAEISVPNDLNPFTRWIEEPKTIGRGKEYYQQFNNHPIIEQLGYKNVSI